MTTEQVDAIARKSLDRSRCTKLGLVDEIGGLDTAIKYAAKLGKTNSYRTENFPEYEKSFEDCLANFTGMAMFKTKEQLLKNN